MAYIRIAGTGITPIKGPRRNIESGAKQQMAKAYWIAFYREVRRPDALAAYAKLAGPALEAAGGRMLARGLPAAVHEAGVVQRTVLIEFDSLEKAKAAYESPAYRAALAVLGDAVDRDIRFVEAAG
jgi:uncharacterized protein (DUF1330 family)